MFGGGNAIWRCLAKCFESPIPKGSIVAHIWPTFGGECWSYLPFMDRLGMVTRVKYESQIGGYIQGFKHLLLELECMREAIKLFRRSSFIAEKATTCGRPCLVRRPRRCGPGTGAVGAGRGLALGVSASQVERWRKTDLRRLEGRFMSLREWEWELSEDSFGNGYRAMMIEVHDGE